MVATTSASAQVGYPSNPQSMDQCDAAKQHWMVYYRREHDAGSSLNSQSNALQAPPGCFGNEHCRNNYYATKKQYHERISHHFRERDRIEREGNAADRACRSVASQHERAREEQARMQREQQEAQRRQAQENQRRAEQQQREAVQQQRELAQRQQEEHRRAAEDHQRRAEQHQREVTARQQEAQRQYETQARAQQQVAQEQQRQRAQSMQAASQQLQEAMQRQAEREQARQPRVIAEIPDSGRGPAVSQVQTPAMRAQAQADAAAQQEQARRAEAQALRDVLTPQGRNASAAQLSTTIEQMGDGVSSIERARRAQTDAEHAKAVDDGLKAADKASQARRQMLDQVLNPNRVESKPIDNLVADAQRGNEQINSARGVSPAATQIANDALGALGSTSKSTSGSLAGALQSLDALGAPAQRPAAGPSASSTSPTAPAAPPSATLDDLAAATAPVAQNCRPIDILMDAREGRAGDTRIHLGVRYACKAGKWERVL